MINELGEKYPNQILRKIFNFYFAEFERLAKDLEIKDSKVTRLVYSSVSVCSLRVRRKGKVYHYVQLKAFLQEGKSKKSVTLQTWKEEEAPLGKLSKFTRLYRGLCALQKAIEYLDLN